MRFSTAASAAALVAGASASYSNATIPSGTGSHPVYTTEVLTAFTTYCPSPTEIVHSSKTYTVTEATTLTITDCPCTVTKPISSAVVTYCPTCPPTGSDVPAVPIPTGSVSYSNGTVPIVPPTPTSVPGAASSSVAPTAGTTTGAAAPTFTGAANKAFAASGAGLAGLLGLAAYIL
ncbi:MAG: hypothetical protein M1837_000256 [Sclerophora amabilis]|nr:MAG: hypothetical protein M1837_000256 [Sclerophora amabilis]